MVGAVQVGGGNSHAFLTDGATLTDLGTLGGTGSGAGGINDAGWVVGVSDVPGGSYRAFLYRDGVMADLGISGSYNSAAAVNNAGQIVGYAGSHAFLYQDGVETDLGTLGGPASRATAISEAGQVVGYADTADQTHAFLYRDGVMTDLGVLPGDYLSAAYGVNSFGDVVGTSYHLDSHGMITYRPFLYQGGVLIPLNNLLPPNSGWVLTHVYGINDAGQITGYGTSPSGRDHGFLLTPGGRGHHWDFSAFLTQAGPGVAATAVIGTTPSVGQILLQVSTARSEPTTPPPAEDSQTPPRAESEGTRLVVRPEGGMSHATTDFLAGDLVDGIPPRPSNPFPE